MHPMMWIRFGVVPFEPVATIKRVIDSLTFAKLNVLHWHLVDSQSFPFDSPSYPSLGKEGAYSNEERYLGRTSKAHEFIVVMVAFAFAPR